MPQTGLSVLQFTDPHIYADREDRLAGRDTRASFLAVRDLALECALDCDVVLLTGDLAANAERGAYSWLVEQLSAFDAPIYCLPGNHDAARIMAQQVSAAGWRYCGDATIAPWYFVLLNSALDGAAQGYLSRSELERLDVCLSNNPVLPTLLALHHHPIPMRSLWMDTMVLQNAAEFWSIVDKYPQVRCVLWGHVHQNFDTFRNGVRLLTTPSTCVQFAARSAEFAMARLSPGFRVLRLLPSGNLTTHVVRLGRSSLEL